MDAQQLLNDVYYSRAYAELNLGGGETVYEFEHKEGDQWLYHSALKRPVPNLTQRAAPDSCFDLETPYGYGGPITNSSDPSFVRRALAEHGKKASDEGVVGEFIRFHPFNNFPEAFPNALSLIAQERRTVSIPLDRSSEEIFASFRSSLRRNIRKAIRNEVGFEEVTQGVDLDDLLFLYHGMVQRKALDESYFFGRGYFERLLKLEETRIFASTVNGHVANYIVVFDSPPLLHYHIGATREEYYSLNVNPYCFYRIIEALNGRSEAFFLGGGSSWAEEDPLFRFKAKFSDQILPFYIGGAVHDQSKYEALCKAWEAINPERKGLKRMLKYRF